LKVTVPPALALPKVYHAEVAQADLHNLLCSEKDCSQWRQDQTTKAKSNDSLARSSLEIKEQFFTLKIFISARAKQMSKTTLVAWLCKEFWKNQVSSVYDI